MADEKPTKPKLADLAKVVVIYETFPSEHRVHDTNFVIGPSDEVFIDMIARTPRQITHKRRTYELTKDSAYSKRDTTGKRGDEGESPLRIRIYRDIEYRRV